MRIWEEVKLRIKMQSMESKRAKLEYKLVKHYFKYGSVAKEIGDHLKDGVEMPETNSAIRFFVAGFGEIESNVNVMLENKDSTQRERNKLLGKAEQDSKNERR